MGVLALPGGPPRRRPEGARRRQGGGERLSALHGAKLLSELRIEPGSKPKLDARDPGVRIGASSKSDGLERLQSLVERLADLHNRLWAEATRSVLLILQGMDASGKDGTIRHVLTGINPQGTRIVSFKLPTPVDLAHDYLWRVHALCPSRGELGIFNRSHYEDIVAVRVHGLQPKPVWSKRYEHIRSFERLLVDEGTSVLKVFLHVSRDEQRRRLQERLDDPDKRWKFRSADLDDRKLWDEYAVAYDETLEQTSTEWAPWYAVPADHNWVRNLCVAEIVVDALERLDPKMPSADPALEGRTIEP